MTHPTEVKLPESLEVVAWAYYDGERENFPSGPNATLLRSTALSFERHPHYRNETPLVRLSDAESALKARDAEIERLRGDALGALVLALSCIRWQSFGECRTPGHGGAPPAPDTAAKAIEAAIATLGGRGQ